MANQNNRTNLQNNKLDIQDQFVQQFDSKICNRRQISPTDNMHYFKPELKNMKLMQKAKQKPKRFTCDQVNLHAFLVVLRYFYHCK